MATFFNQTKWYSTQKKRLFQMTYFKFHEKNSWESSKLTDSKINPSRENHAHFISCKPPHKTHPREYFWTTLWFIQIATSVLMLRNLKFYQLHFIWVPLYEFFFKAWGHSPLLPRVTGWHPGVPLCWSPLILLTILPYFYRTKYFPACSDPTPIIHLNQCPYSRMLIKAREVHPF